MTKINPRAKAALKMNLYLKEVVSECIPERKSHIKPSRKVKVKKEDGIVIEECHRSCNRCPMRFRCYTERDVVLTEEEWKKIDITKGTGRTLKQWKERILEEMYYVDVKPYSHNIISLSLSAIARGWGKSMANKIVEEFGLETLGWSKN